jgi:hypothetical protein
MSPVKSKLKTLNFASCLLSPCRDTVRIVAILVTGTQWGSSDSRSLLPVPFPPRGGMTSGGELQGGVNSLGQASAVCRALRSHFHCQPPFLHLNARELSQTTSRCSWPVLFHQSPWLALWCGPRTHGKLCPGLEKMPRRVEPTGNRVISKEPDEPQLSKLLFKWSAEGLGSVSALLGTF